MTSTSLGLPGWTDMRRWTGGLGILPANPRRAALAVLAGMSGTAAFIALLDLGLFRGHLPEGYVAFYSSPLWPRLATIAAQAALEDLKYRFVLMTALVAAAVLLIKRPPSAALVLTIAIFVQFANVGAWVLADPLYASLRYWLVGTTWGWLYWRHGLIAAITAHAGTHLILDPVLLLGLRQPYG